MTADRIGFEQRCGWGTPRVEGLVHCPRKRLSCTLTAIPCLRYGCGTHAFRRKLSPGECMKISLRITVTVRLTDNESSSVFAAARPVLTPLHEQYSRHFIFRER